MDTQGVQGRQAYEMPGDQVSPVLTIHLTPSVLAVPKAPRDPEPSVLPAMVCILVPWAEMLAFLVVASQQS